MNLRRWPLALAAGVLALAGCSTQLGPPTASLDNVQRLRSAGVMPVALGEFTLGAGAPARVDQGISIRGLTVGSGQGGMAGHLKATLAAELLAAGLLDPRSSAVIHAQLTDSEVDAAIREGTGRLAARFSVYRDGREVWARDIAVTATWPSSFVGVEAASAAINEYGLLHRKLVAKLIDDPGFRAALGP